MIVEKTNWGLKVIIPKTDHSSEYVWNLRQVRVINNDCEYEQELLAKIEKQEKPLTKEFLKLAEEMEEWFHILHTHEDWEDYTAKYGDFNANYHDKLKKIEEQIQNCSYEYANKSKHGWCL